MIDTCMALDQSVSPHTGVQTIQKTGVFWQAVFQPLRPYSLFFEHGSAAKTLISQPHNTASYAGYAMVGCFKLSLYANGLVMSMWLLFSAMIEMTCHVNYFLISDNDVISLESRPLNFRVFIHAYSLRPQTYFRSSLTRVLNQFRNK